MSGHACNVSCMCMSRDGTLIASGEDGSVCTI